MERIRSERGAVEKSMNRMVAERERLEDVHEGLREFATVVLRPVMGVAMIFAGIGSVGVLWLLGRTLGLVGYVSGLWESVWGGDGGFGAIIGGMFLTAIPVALTGGVIWWLYDLWRQWCGFIAVDEDGS